MHQKRLVVLEMGYKEGYESCRVSLYHFSPTVPSFGMKLPAGPTDLEAELLFSKRIVLTQTSPRLSDKNMTVRNHTLGSSSRACCSLQSLCQPWQKMVFLGREGLCHPLHSSTQDVPGNSNLLFPGVQLRNKENCAPHSLSGTVLHRESNFHMNI